MPVADYFDLVKMPTFSTNDAVELAGNLKAAQSLLRRLMGRGLVKKVRSQLYAPVSPGTDRVIASRFQVASAINQRAYVSHHTALEYYGVANQVFYDVYVSSASRFPSFAFEGWTYRRVPSRFEDGVVTPRNTTGVRITDLERTVVDSIRDFEKIGGLDELLSCLGALTFLDVEGLLRYLGKYDSQVLYQKTGYILEHYRDALKLSDSFFSECMRKTGRSTRYLLSHPLQGGVYDGRWQLVVPQGLFEVGGNQIV
jgi:predicted transcriptional regulator of viral defense system